MKMIDDAPEAAALMAKDYGIPEPVALAICTSMMNVVEDAITGAAHDTEDAIIAFLKRAGCHKEALMVRGFVAEVQRSLDADQQSAPAAEEPRDDKATPREGGS